MMHLAKQPLSDRMAECGQPADTQHERTLIAADVECPACLQLIKHKNRTRRVLGRLVRG